MEKAEYFLPYNLKGLQVQATYFTGYHDGNL